MTTTSQARACVFFPTFFAIALAQPTVNHRTTHSQPPDNPQAQPPRHTPKNTHYQHRDTPAKNPKTIISIHGDHLAIVTILQYPVKIYCDDFITFFGIGAFLFHFVCLLLDRNGF